MTGEFMDRTATGVIGQKIVRIARCCTGSKQYDQGSRSNLEDQIIRT